MADVCRLDRNKALSALVWQAFPGPIRVLLDNPYVFQPFWDAQGNPRSDGSIAEHWRESFDEARQRVHQALARQDTERVLYEVFVRLYTLRNQLMHGGATRNSSVNRAQVRDGRALLVGITRRASRVSRFIRWSAASTEQTERTRSCPSSPAPCVLNAPNAAGQRCSRRRRMRRPSRRHRRARSAITRT